MKKLVQSTSILPIFLIMMYIGLFFFIDMQKYADWYEGLRTVDNVLVIATIASYVLWGFKIWDNISSKSFWTVLLLNAVTELDISNYYQLYKLIIYLFLITMVMVHIPPLKRQPV